MKNKFYFIIILILCISNHSLGYETKNLTNIKSSVVELFTDNSNQLPRLKNLKYISGLEINANHPDFGGLSGLIINNNYSFHAIGDQGIWVTGKLNLDDKNKINSISDAKLGYLKNENDNYLVRLGKSFTDAEAIEIYDEKLIVSFERNHRILLYNQINKKPYIFYDKLRLLDLPNNGGIEAMASLKDNSLFLLSEDLVTSDDKLMGFILKNNKLKKVFINRSGSFKPTDLSALPSGDIILLERSYSPIKGAAAKISLIKLEDLLYKEIIFPIQIDIIAPPMVVDNFEGISILELEGGGFDIFILSDDNFNAFQKTLLFQFYWDGKIKLKD